MKLKITRGYDEIKAVRVFDVSRKSKEQGFIANLKHWKSSHKRRSLTCSTSVRGRKKRLWMLQFLRNQAGALACPQRNDAYDKCASVPYGVVH